MDYDTVTNKLFDKLIGVYGSVDQDQAANAVHYDLRSSLVGIWCKILAIIVNFSPHNHRF